MRGKITLKEELDRMKYLSGLISEATPAQAAPAQAPQPGQTQQVEPDPAKAAQTVQTNMDQGMDAMIKMLPNILKNFTKTAGDKDGQLETGEEPKTPAPGQTQAQGQAPVQESEKNQRELMFDEEKFRRECEGLDEGLIAGLVASAPAIMQLGGKLMQKMGGKTNPNFIQKWGKTVAHAGEKLHHKYLGLIEKVIAPLMPSAKPETKKKAAEAVFMVMVSGLFASHLAHPDMLSVVKGKELVDYVSKIMPTALASVGFA